MLNTTGTQTCGAGLLLRSAFSRRPLQTFLDDLSHLAILTPGALTLAVITEDPPNDRYLEGAVEGEAAYIISGDQLLLHLGAYQGIPILTLPSQTVLQPLHHSPLFPTLSSQTREQYASTRHPACTRLRQEAHMCISVVRLFFSVFPQTYWLCFSPPGSVSRRVRAPLSWPT